MRYTSGEVIEDYNSFRIWDGISVLGIIGGIFTVFIVSKYRLVTAFLSSLTIIEVIVPTIFSDNFDAMLITNSFLLIVVYNGLP